MDRNSIIGFVLLLLLGTGYIFWSNHEQKAFLAKKAADSVAAVHRAQISPVKSASQNPQKDSNSTAVNTVSDTTTSKDSLFHGKTTYTAISNNVLALQFSSKGGYPVQATLKKFKNYGGGVVNYFDGANNGLSISIPYNGQTISTQELFFTPSVTKLGDSSQRLTMTAQLGKGKQVVFYYVLPKTGYMMTAGIQLNGFGNDLTGLQSIPMTWETAARKTEKDMENERYYMQAHLQFQNGDNDYFTLSRSEKEKMDHPVKWFSIRSHFFNSTLIADNAFDKASYTAQENKKDDSSIIVVSTNHFDLPVSKAGSGNYEFGFRWLISPNDYQLLRSYNIGLDEIISLGYGPFFFVKYISKWIIIPLFNFLVSTVGNIGVSIILLILIIRLFLSFFSYKSYLSGAKMRVLKPELEELKKKVGNDKQQMGIEQMKLYKTAGVNPLGGCLPMLLQMPFLLAVYYFIPTAIQLRQVPFLWAKDLSTYDNILNLPFNIPMYGSHVSLFTLLMTVTSLFLAIYNKNGMTGGAPGGGSSPEMEKMMKFMPYIAPFMFLGWFNSMAAGLTLYYTCSNLISMGQQLVIQKYFINEESIHAKIQERKNRPEKANTSKWQQRLEQMQKIQAEKMKNKR